MALDNLRNLHQQVILEHYKKPRHRGKTSPIDRSHRGHNPFCGDTIELTVQLNHSQSAIESVKFGGEGCTIAMSSTDLMADSMHGKTIEEAVAMMQRFQEMMKGNGEFPRKHRKLNVMQGVAQFPVRIKCATLTWHALNAALESSGIVDTDAFVSNEEEG